MAKRNFFGDPSYYLAANSDAVVVTTTTDETTSATVTIPGGSLHVGDRILIDGHAYVTSAQSTDTHQVLIDLGTSGGTMIAVIVGHADDVVTGDICKFHAQLSVTAIGRDATASLVGHGESMWSTAWSR